MTALAAAHRAQSRISTYWAGGVIVLAMLIGGGSAGGLLSDRIIQLAMLPLLLVGVVRMSHSRLSPAAIVWLVALLAVLLWQLFPVGLVFPAAAEAMFVSAAPGKALDYAVFAICLAGFALFVSTLSDAAQRRLLLFFMLGYFLNLTMAATQLSFVGGTSPFSSVFYTFRQGAFANANHFSSLIYALIPLFAFVLLHERQQRLLYGLVVGSALVILLAANARAAVAIAAIVSIAAYVAFSGRHKTQGVRIVLLLLSALIVIGIINFVFLDYAVEAFQRDLRQQYAINTLNAAIDHAPWGAGLGTFRTVYPQYEALETISLVYANRAHNDYAELLLELGLAGAVLIATLLALVLRHMLRTPLALAYGMSVLAIFVHSLVDYPLRTFAVGLLFCHAVAVIVSRPEPNAGRT